MKKAKEIIFLIAVAIMFFAVAAMAEQENMVLWAVITIAASIVAWICVDKTNITNLRW